MKWIDDMILRIVNCAAMAHEQQVAVARRLDESLDLTSRDGVEGALWNILTVSLVAAIAAAVLFILGPKIIDLGKQAVDRVQAPPW